jgi:hypothetical protein
MAENPTPLTLKVSAMTVPESAVAPSESLTKVHAPTNVSVAALTGMAAAMKAISPIKLMRNFL